MPHDPHDDDAPGFGLRDRIAHSASVDASGGYSIPGTPFAAAPYRSLAVFAKPGGGGTFSASVTWDFDGDAGGATATESKTATLTAGETLIFRNQGVQVTDVTIYGDATTAYWVALSDVDPLVKATAGGVEACVAFSGNITVPDNDYTYRVPFNSVRTNSPSGRYSFDPAEPTVIAVHEHGLYLVVCEIQLGDGAYARSVIGGAESGGFGFPGARSRYGGAGIGSGGGPNNWWNTSRSGIANEEWLRSWDSIDMTSWDAYGADNKPLSYAFMFPYQNTGAPLVASFSTMTILSIGSSLVTIY